ncbi:MAG: 4-(cytidine 5'-diphospho)-2-C-methyl-D-erythritol kinase [Acidobacteria bacterium]|nr:4-(cytidine 5'-diphospho)-2-C-methyl-D-erythritol kinase [Acidobacteriota bacterium]
MTVRAFAKLNLALEVLGPRPDGYTEIATVFQTIDLCDRLELRADPALPGALELETAGREPCPPEQNLAWRAARSWLERAEEPFGVSIRLVKVLPAGAGLGGGSADAAAVLLGLERLAVRPLGERALAALAAALGADVPYLLEGGLALGTGRGDRLEPLADLPPRPAVVAWPGIELSTAEVYRRTRAGLTAIGPASKMRRFLSRLKPSENDIPVPFNDLYPAAAALAPAVERLAGKLSALGGRGGMTGSGSAVFGLFHDGAAAAQAAQRLQDDEPAAWVRPAWTLPRPELAARRFVEDPDGRITAR